MCGRFALHANPEVVALQFGLEQVPQFQPHYNIAPAASVVIVRGRQASLAHWGLRRKFANLRAETLAQKFPAPYREGRALVPASGFYEWQPVAGKKQPWYVLPSEQRLFALGGIVLLWQGVRSVAIVTTAANAVMAKIHDRMPVLVGPESYDTWLGTGDASALLAPAPDDAVQAHPVSLRVNAPANDDEALLRPI